MGIYNNLVLLGLTLERVSAMPYDYITHSPHVTWSGYIFNNTEKTIKGCCMITSPQYVGAFELWGSVESGYVPITSSWVNTCYFGDITGGGMLPVIVRVVPSVLAMVLAAGNVEPVVAPYKIFSIWGE